MELIKIEERDGEQVVSGRELHKFLEVKTKYIDWFNRMVDYGFVENVDFTTINERVSKKEGSRTVKREQINHTIQLDMAKEICYRTKRSPRVNEVLKRLGVDVEQLHTSTRFEVSFGNMLREALGELGIEIVEQYNVDGYRIDFYIPQFNLAVEYDEQQHFITTNHEKDLERQKCIEDKLGCKFIRCDYRDSDIKNVMKVIKEVM